MAAADRRWLIVGGSGSGKSTLARRLGERLDLPVIHLDRHYWRSGWEPTPNEQWDRRVSQLAGGDAWVMDGNYSRTLHLRLPRAHRIVLLDRNPMLCLSRVLQRIRTQPRPDIPADCPDRFPDREFLWWILSYRWRSKPKVLARVATYPELPLTVLRSDRAVERFLAEVGG
jgi:adenylate kinase family enzyme